MIRIFTLAALVLGSSGQFQKFTFKAKSKKGKMCERHMQLQSCLGKKPGDCRHCSSSMAKRCGKTMLKNLCHLHYAGPPKKAKNAPQPKLSATMSKADHLSADDDDAPVSVRTGTDAIIKKLNKLKGRLEAHAALVKHKQERKAKKKAYGLTQHDTRSPTAAPSFAPTKTSALNYANGVRKATLEAMGQTESEGAKLWGQVNKENAEQDKAEMQSPDGDNTITASTSAADSVDTGESMCEEHGYNKKQCKTIGCCTFLSGLCWSAIGAKMCTAAPAFLRSKPKTPAPTPHALSRARITKHASVTSPSPTPAPVKLTGEVACEEHGYTQSQCGAVGCCTFMSGLCWSAVGKKACATTQPAKHKHKHIHRHNKQHPLADGGKRKKHKHPHAHHRHKVKGGITTTAYPTPHPTAATSAPSMAPTPDQEEKEEHESAIEDRIFAATSAKSHTGKHVAITPAPTLQAGVSTAAATRIKMHGIQGLTKYQACSHLESMASKTCKFLLGRGTTCAKKCDDMILHMRSARPYLALCDFQWKKKVHEDICWPKDCTPTIHYFCSPYMHSVLQGFKGTTRVYYDVCELCMMHYIWMKPNIPGGSCWQKKIQSGFCPAGWRNLPKGSKKTQLTMHNLKQALSQIPEHSLPQFRAK